jgi:hypothetical protein
MSANYSLAGKLISLSVTIPVNGSAVSIKSLVAASMPSGVAWQGVLSVNVRGKIAAGTDRGAFLFGGSASESKSYVCSADAEEKPCNKIENIFVEATDATPVSAVFDLWINV